MILILAIRGLIHQIAAQSPIQPVANLGTGFMSEFSSTPRAGMIQDMLTRYSEYNPPDFVLEAHKHALDEIEGNQYAPVTVNTSLEKGLAKNDFATIGYGLPQGGPVISLFSHLL